MPPCCEVVYVLADMKECTGGNRREWGAGSRDLAKPKTGCCHPTSGVSGHSGKAGYEYSLWTGK